MKQFEIPEFYRSPIISKVKAFRKAQDPRKKDFTPTLLDFGNVKLAIARHFGFCYGVENAIEIAYRAIAENEGKRIFLLSQMIHNPGVNEDLTNHGITFIQDTEGKQLIDWSEITAEDVVIIPAFGTTLEIEALLKEKGVNVEQYNTTCPFVEKVWNRSEKLAQDQHTLVIHGKYNHEETRATFSHTAAHTQAVIVKDLAEAQLLGECITGKRSAEEFYTLFKGKYTEGFDPAIHFSRLGVINQTTMLATETQAIADYFRQLMTKTYGLENLKNHFADTRDTLCYATNDNQDSTYQLLNTAADLAIVVGGYNSSNTSHIVELCEGKFATYFINSDTEIKSKNEIHHFDYPRKQKRITNDFLTGKDVVNIILTSGASCPDTLVDRVMLKVVEYFPGAKPIDAVMSVFENSI
ncbi:MAG: 4-hydroxy-3-methylbut-2-enyl diphosphate reductase [Flavobacteriia bacterium]|nr:4-hydroxy-3-methylbut-2-enyl diphosphate reductase [Flavobacteriia bacterium]